MAPLTARFSNEHRNIFKEQKFQIVTVKKLQKISHADQKIKLNDRPRIKSNWAQQKMLAGVGWFSRELPLTPTIVLQKMFSAQLKTTISKEGKNAARSQTVMEIPAITSETLTAPKPQHVNKIPVPTILYKKAIING